MMCACEPGYVCSRCVDTPHDPGYADNDPGRDMDERYAEAYAPRGLIFNEDVEMPALEDFL